LVNFGPETAENGPFFDDSTHPKPTFSDAHISGPIGAMPLKISQW